MAPLPESTTQIISQSESLVATNQDFSIDPTITIDIQDTNPTSSMIKRSRGNSTPIISEEERTIAIGKKLGFDIEIGNVILQEVLGGEI